MSTGRTLLPVAMGVIAAVFGRYATMPFDLRMDEFTDFAMAQFRHR